MSIMSDALLKWNNRQQSVMRDTDIDGIDLDERQPLELPFDEPGEEGIFAHSEEALYIPPTSIEEALNQSLNEEETAIDWYRRRAKFASANGDMKSARIWLHIADEEANHHKEFSNRLAGIPYKPGDYLAEKMRHAWPPEMGESPMHDTSLMYKSGDKINEGDEFLDTGTNQNGIVVGLTGDAKYGTLILTDVEASVRTWTNPDGTTGKMDIPEGHKVYTPVEWKRTAVRTKEATGQPTRRRRATPAQ